MKPQNEIVATFSDLDKAQAVKVKLEQAGIPAKVLDQSKLQRFVYLSKPLACDKVLVEEADYEKARTFLVASDAKDHILQDEVHCLQCGSPHVDYPQFTRKFVTTSVFGVFFSLLHLIDRTFYCQDCHYTWPAKDNLRSRNDLLNWPTHRGVEKRGTRINLAPSLSGFLSLAEIENWRLKICQLQLTNSQLSSSHASRGGSSHLVQGQSGAGAHALQDAARSPEPATRPAGFGLRARQRRFHGPPAAFN